MQQTLVVRKRSGTGEQNSAPVVSQLGHEPENLTTVVMVAIIVANRSTSTLQMWSMRIYNSLEPKWLR